jgi:hypothetical protein
MKSGLRYGVVILLMVYLWPMVLMKDDLEMFNQALCLVLAFFMSFFLFFIFYFYNGNKALAVFKNEFSILG